ASTSTSDGMLTLDLIQEEETSAEDHSTCEENFRVDLDKSVAHLTAGRRRADSESTKPLEKERTGSLPRQDLTSWVRAGQGKDSLDKGTMYTPQVPKKLSPMEKNKCASMEEILSRRDSSAPRAPLRKGLEIQFVSAEPEQLSRLQELVALKLEKTQELLTEVQGYGEGKRKPKDINTNVTSTTSSSTTSTTSSSSASSKLDSERILQESERLLGEASSTWSQAKRVLQEIRELRDLYKQFELPQSDSKAKQSSQSQFRKSMM
ncbi:PREDICTED: pleckstrin homology domain-containing family O member 1, partial [Acanthisitta chloris]